MVISLSTAQDRVCAQARSGQSHDVSVVFGSVREFALFGGGPGALPGTIHSARSSRSDEARWVRAPSPAAAPPDTISLHRKLDPIYECVDTGQNKAALKLIGDLLKKYPTLQIARVLKGITLSRMGMEDQGMELCEEVRAEGPADDTVLNTLALFYKNVGAAQQQVEMFEQASERDPATRAPHPPVPGLREGLRLRQAAAVRYEAIQAHEQPQARHVGHLRHAHAG